MISKKKQTNKKYILITVLVIIVAFVAGWFIFKAVSNKSDTDLQTQSKQAYVDGNNAVEQVSSFYRDYIKFANDPSRRKTPVNIYGNANLAFYYDYYLHGFDPITCSKILPSKVTASLVSTGSQAKVNVVAVYPDNSTSTMLVTVVLHDSLQIDSVTCPDNKANLAPNTTL